VNDAYLALVNPAAGGGRCGKQVAAALANLRSDGLDVEVIETTAPGDAIDITRRAYADGYRRFIAVGGDGTSHEIVNGLLPEALDSAAHKPDTDESERPLLAFLPLGTGNSFLRDFSSDPRSHAVAALREGRRQPCDIMRLRYTGGELYSLNLISMGMTAQAASITNRRLKPFGSLGYLLAVLACLARIRYPTFPIRLDAEPQVYDEPALMISFNNSKYTGGAMMIAPEANYQDGLIEIVRLGAISRLGALRHLPGIYDGSHMKHPLAWRRSARSVELLFDMPTEIVIDGEVLRLSCQQIDLLPAAIDVAV
jgi:diacylglycerol kinase (ATP)